MLSSSIRTVLAIGVCSAAVAAPALAVEQASPARPPESVVAAARGYLQALKSEQGSKVCPLVTAATKRAFIDQARSDGLKVTRCEPAVDHDLYKIGRVLGSFQIIRVVVHGRVAYATVNDARISDGGNDMFSLQKTSAGRWLVDDS